MFFLGLPPSLTLPHKGGGNNGPPPNGAPSPWMGEGWGGGVWFFVRTGLSRG